MAVSAALASPAISVSCVTHIGVSPDTHRSSTGGYRQTSLAGGGLDSEQHCHFCGRPKRTGGQKLHLGVAFPVSPPYPLHLPSLRSVGRRWGYGGETVSLSVPSWHSSECPGHSIAGENGTGGTHLTICAPGSHVAFLSGFELRPSEFQAAPFTCFRASHCLQHRLRHAPRTR
jgi:hypothetical protein